MRVSIPTAELREAVTGLGKVVARNTALPILRGVFFEATDEGVTARATDLDSSLCYRFQEAESRGTGAFVLDLGDLRTVLKGRSERTAFDCPSGDRVTVELTSKGQTLTRPLPALDAEEFPPATETRVETAPAAGLLESYRMLATFASEDPTRAVLNGVCLDATGKGKNAACMVATDGRRLACRNTMSLPIAGQHILPISKFLQWNKLEGDAGLGVNTGKNGACCAIRVGPWDFHTRTIEGTYPNWRQVVPSDAGQHTMHLGETDAALLLSTLPTLDGCETVTFAVENGQVKVWARREQDPDWTSFVLPGSSCTQAEPSARITCSREFVLDALKAGFLRTFSFENDLSPLVSRDDAGGTHVLMPMRDAGLPEHLTSTTNEEETLAPEEEPEKETHEKGETPMPKIDAPKNEVTPAQSAIDRAFAAYEQARGKLRELQTALSELSGELKAGVRDQKSQAREMEAARAALSKLQSISL